MRLVLNDFDGAPVRVSNLMQSSNHLGELEAKAFCELSGAKALRPRPKTWSMSNNSALDARGGILAKSKTSQSGMEKLTSKCPNPSLS